MKILMLQTKKLSEPIYEKTCHALGCNESNCSSGYLGRLDAVSRLSSEGQMAAEMSRTCFAHGSRRASYVVIETVRKRLRRNFFRKQYLGQATSA